MHAITLFSLLLGLAAASPTAGGVKMDGFTLTGTGCPDKDSFKTQITDDRLLVEAGFSKYVIKSGPKADVSDRRKNCKISLNLSFQKGYQFRILDTAMDGFADIPDGVEARCSNTFTFTRNPSDKRVAEVCLNGPRSGPFSLEAKRGFSAWSPCSSHTEILNMNTDCSIDRTKKEAQIAIDGVSGSLKVKCKMQWRPCPLKSS